MFEKLLAVLGWDVWFQNLSREEVPGSPPWHGRASLTFHERGVGWLRSVRVEWLLAPNRTVKFGVDADPSEAEVGVTFALPPVTLYLHAESDLAAVLTSQGERYEARTAEVSLHSGSIWWQLWTDPMHWRSETPRWRAGSVKLWDVTPA